MGKTICFLCKKEIDMMQFKITIKYLNSQNKIVPSEMTSDDRICNPCNQSLAKHEKTKKIRKADEIMWRGITWTQGIAMIVILHVAGFIVYLVT